MSKKRKSYLRSYLPNTSSNDEFSRTQAIDSATQPLIDRFENQFEYGRYTVYCIELDKVFSFRIVSMKQRVIYHGGQDANGYAQGQLIEERYANVDPKHGIISEDSPMGKRLLSAKIGDKFNIGASSEKKVNYVVLNVPQNKNYFQRKGR